MVGVESKLNQVEVELRAKKGLSYGYSSVFLRHTHKGEEHLFSMFPSIITSNFVPIQRSFLACWAIMGDQIFQKIVLRSAHIVQQLLYPSILTFDFV